MAYFESGYVEINYSVGFTGDYLLGQADSLINVSEVVGFTLRQVLASASDSLAIVENIVATVILSLVVLPTEIMSLGESTIFKKKTKGGFNRSALVTTLYSLVLTNGTRFYFTNSDVDILSDGNLYHAMPITHSDVISSISTENNVLTMRVGSVILTDYVSTDHNVYDLVKYSNFKGATLSIHYFDEENIYKFLLYSGDITGNITYSDFEVSFTSNSPIQKALKDIYPKMLYSPTCQHKVYGVGCGLDIDNWKTSCVVDNGSTTNLIYSVHIDFDDYVPYVNGSINVLSGSNKGQVFRIISIGDGYLTFYPTAEYEFYIGDNIEIAPACDKSSTTCDLVFDNYENFFGFETIPSENILTTYFR